MRSSFKPDSQRMRDALRTWTVRSGAALALLVCAGCAAPPPVHFHTLLATERPMPREGMPAAPAGPAIFVLEAIKVPAQVNQPQWLVRLPDDTLALLEQERWASPLPEELHEALLEVLRLRFGAVDARSPGAGTAQWRIRVEVTRFESSPGEARIESTWALAPRAADARAVLRCRSDLRESAGADAPALAAAHRRLVARLGDGIGEQLLTLQRGESGRCPG